VIREASDCPTRDDQPTNERMSAFYTAHTGSLTRFLFRLTGGPRQTVEDLLQETMLRAWRHFGSVPLVHDEARRWLFTVARRLVIDHARMRQARLTEVSADYLDVHPTADDTTDLALAAHAIPHAFRQLSPTHQSILRELYLRGRSTTETAEILDVPVGTVKSRAHYALASLRHALDYLD
jgi:RNA polymerase sigma factor (sigma-70 family)